MDNKQTSLLPDNALTELTKGVYSDVGHPVLKEAGSIGASLMKLVALPFKFLGMTADQLENKYAEFLKNSISKVEPEDRVIPKAAVVSPLLEHVNSRISYRHTSSINTHKTIRTLSNVSGTGP